jgi:hypothetical protein
VPLAQVVVEQVGLVQQEMPQLQTLAVVLVVAVHGQGANGGSGS